MTNYFTKASDLLKEKKNVNNKLNYHIKNQDGGDIERKYYHLYKKYKSKYKLLYIK